jgi:hypothetical protein
LFRAGTICKGQPGRADSPARDFSAALAIAVAIFRIYLGLQQ